MTAAPYPWRRYSGGVQACQRWEDEDHAPSKIIEGATDDPGLGPPSGRRNRTENPGQTSRPSPGRTHDRHRANFVAASGHIRTVARRDPIAVIKRLANFLLTRRALPGRFGPKKCQGIPLRSHQDPWPGSSKPVLCGLFHRGGHRPDVTSPVTAATCGGRAWAERP